MAFGQGQCYNDQGTRVQGSLWVIRWLFRIYEIHHDRQYKKQR